MQTDGPTDAAACEFASSLLKTQNGREKENQIKKSRKEKRREKARDGFLFIKKRQASKSKGKTNNKIPSKLKNNKKKIIE